jgi:hypothetical protein
MSVVLGPVVDINLFAAIGSSVAIGPTIIAL